MLRLLLVFFCWGLFLSNAQAGLGPLAGKSGGSPLFQFIPLVLIFAVFWFLIIRPQQKRLRTHRSLVANLKAGNKIWTDSGIQGVIKTISADEISLEIAPKILIKIKRARASELIGTAKAVAPPAKKPSKKSPSKKS